MAPKIITIQTIYLFKLFFFLGWLRIIIHPTTINHPVVPKRFNLWISLLHYREIWIDPMQQK